VACLSFGRNRRSYRVQAEQAAALLAQSELARAEQRRADVLDERARIAREIHDVLAHSLGALGIQIQTAKAILTDRHDIDGAVEALTSAQRMAADGLTETRRAVHALRVDTLRVDTLPLAQELAVVVETHRQRYRVPVAFETSGAARPLPPDAALALLRAGQEALVNAAKHAPGQPVGVRLDYGDDDVLLGVINHLNGAAPQVRSATSAGGYGLTGMRERLRLLNAAGGLTVFDPRVHATLLAATAAPPAVPRIPGPPDGLTHREAEILALIAQGLNNAEIAERLFRSSHTIKTHINRIFTKTGSRDRIAAIAYAQRRNITGA
jgi:signal transduction histidine kinase